MENIFEFINLPNTLFENNNFVTINSNSNFLRSTNSQITNISKQSNTESLKDKVRQAAQNRKIFTIYDGFPEIRHALLKRGWIEKCAPNYLENIHSLPDEIIKGLKRPGNIYETVTLSKIAKQYHSNFIWQPNNEINTTEQRDRVKPYRSGIYRSNNLNFTTKQGLNNCIENAYWNTVEGMSEIRAPRHHNISNPDEHLDFLRDYRSTYCCSLLKIIFDSSPLEMFSRTGDLPLKTVEFAMDRIRKEIKIRTVTDINVTGKKNPFGDEYKNNTEWPKFYSSVNMLVKKIIKIKAENLDIENSVRNQCRELTDKCKKFWPLIQSEGYNNLWILKPGSSSRGRGICVKNNFHEIINFVDRRPEQQYIIQKYIEQPLLIYNTKFDIRQHILITIVNDRINIWMYNDCYLRFCSQEYDLNNLAESIHITNRAIQQKYENGPRNSQLPDHNMWSLSEFKTYLKTIKKTGIWQNKIYPCMKKNIIGVIMSSLEETELIDNTFDLYGCDFMLDQFYEPLLIEVNSLPSMVGSTCVTAKICPAVLRDLIKVVIDWPNNPNSDTGKFELINSFDFQTELYYFEYNKEFDVIGKNAKTGNNVTSKFKYIKPQKIHHNIIKDEKIPFYLRNHRKHNEKK